jgi:Na+/H+ antiporter NhaD/arsenite permease-like protein
MIPLVQNMGTVFADLHPIWWSLALGACLGGNGTLVGASANLVVAGLAEKSGYKISFLEFMKVGLIIMVITVAISNVYVLLRYF